MNTNTEWLKLDQVLPIIIKANNDLHACFKTQFLEDDPSAIRKYLRDFRTIRLNYGVRTGKTLSIIRMATDDDLIIVRNHVHQVFMQSECKAEVRTIKDLEQSPAITRYCRVWIDEGSWLSPEEMVDIYSLPFLDRDTQFIILG